MQMFNACTMGIVNSYRLEQNGVESGNNSADNSKNYETQLTEYTTTINEITKALTDDNSENDADAENRGKELIHNLNENINESVKNYFENHKESLMNFKIAIEESIRKITEKNGGEFPNTYMPLKKFLNKVEELAKSLGLSQVDEKKGPEIELQLEGNLGEIDKTGKVEKFYSNLDKESGKLNDTIVNIDKQIQDVFTLLSDEKLKDNKDLKNLKDLLENIKTVIEHNSEGNVRALQEYTAENLSAGAKNIFDELSLKSNGEYDGKFGKGTLAGLDELLKKTGIYITEIEKALEAGSAETDQSAPIEETSDGDGENTENKPELDTFELGDGKYTEVENSSNLADKTKLAGTFYLKEGGLEGSAGNEYYVKLSNNPDNVYKVKVDSWGYLYPIATEIDLNLINNKDGKPVQREILISNNDSCKAYLRNKLPAAIKNNCSISWHDGAKDYTLKSYGKQLTIEPMTIAGDWNASENLGEAMAFLNLTNYIRSMGEQYGNIDPDIKFKDGKLIIKGFRDRGGRSHIERNLSEFGLGHLTESDLSKFKRYNNHEKWENNWDKKKDNRDYIKRSFPSIKMNESTSDQNTSTKFITRTETVSGIVKSSSNATSYETGDQGLLGTENVGESVNNSDFMDLNNVKFEDIIYDKEDGIIQSIQFKGKNVKELKDGDSGFGYRKYENDIFIGNWDKEGNIQEGVVLFGDGNRYMGKLKKFINDNNECYVYRHGSGVMEYGNDNKYEGDFKDGRRLQGKMLYGEGGEYEGTFNNSSNKFNEGKFTASNGLEFKITNGSSINSGDNSTLQMLEETEIVKKLNQLSTLLKDATSVEIAGLTSNQIIIRKKDNYNETFDANFKERGSVNSLVDWMNDYIQSHKESA